MSKFLFPHEQVPDTVVFVFGSNLLGIHGAGAARDAQQCWGARWHKGVGFEGQSYAIPTCDIPGRPLARHVIRDYVEEFLDFADAHPELDFQVTAIGCGYAGYDAYDIAPLFAEAPANCHLPSGWRGIIKLTGEASDHDSP